ncbi:unnamed protein product [Blepharisma stoltei]|uniref:Uncharacterized protein n=1 Tax=Blepharisma stoltei TaxID=1481888 RepID=A0AAU9IYQ7_9CILI|nr:unnamed protein product [Blepharisma stoltei]
MVICKLAKCLFEPTIECCGQGWCKRHYIEHSSGDPQSHQGKKLYHAVNVESKNEILSWLYEVKRVLLGLKSKIAIKWIKKIKKGYPGYFLIKKITDVMMSCREIELKVIYTFEVPKKICYNPIEYFLTQPLDKTKVYLKSLDLDFLMFRF